MAAIQDNYWKLERQPKSRLQIILKYIVKDKKLI